MTRETINGIDTLTFDSLYDMYQFGGQAFGRRVCEGNWETQNRYERNWAGRYPTLAAVYAACLKDSEYSARINAIASKLVGQITASVHEQELSMDVTGLGFDMGLVMQGVPECWITQAPSKEPKVVRIGVNTSCSAGIDHKIIINRGIGITALIQVLEASGIGTEVTLCGEGLVAYKYGVHTFTMLKPQGEYFDLEKFAFAICDPSYPRMMEFAVEWQASGIDSYSIAWPSPKVDEIGPAKYDLYLKSMFLYDADFASEESTKAWVVNKAKEFGVEIGAF